MYASYIVWFVCFYLHIIADEESRVDEYLAQRASRTTATTTTVIGRERLVATTTLSCRDSCAVLG